MKIKLITGYEYDLAESGEVAKLKKNISMMKSRGQTDRLLDLYTQVQPFQNYKGTNTSKKNAASICHALAPLFPTQRPLIAPVKISIPHITFPTTKTLEVPREIKMPMAAEEKKTYPTSHLWKARKSPHYYIVS